MWGVMALIVTTKDGGGEALVEPTGDGFMR
jgi:hypothetical protein